MLEVVRPIVIAAAAIAMLTSCAAHDPQTTPIAGEVEIDSRIGQQGRLLLGFKDPDLRTFAMPASVAAPTVTVDGQLVATGLAGTDFVGVAVTATTASGPIAMRIADVIAPDATTPRWQYALEQWDAAAQLWTPACAEPTPVLPLADPIPSPPRAVVIPGRFRGDGIYDLISPLGVSFACQTGVIGKCVGWGFYPGQTWPTTTAHGLPSTANTYDMLAACTRMARADFCAAGAPNTLDGTPIQIDDVFHAYAATPGYGFEAAWLARATVFVEAVHPAPLCLSKLRWSTLPLGGNCPLVLPDPRVDPKGIFCEDLTPERLESKGAMLYSSSLYIDAGLYAHADLATGAVLTTASLVPRRDYAQELPAWQIPTPANVPFPQTGQRHRLDAAIFSHTLPAGLSTSGLALLTSYACPAGDFITSTRPPAGCTPIADEGYVYAAPTAAHPALRTWWSPALQHSYTTTMPASTMLGAGWQLVEVSGGVVRAELEVNVRWAAVPGANYSLDVLTRNGSWVTSCLGAAQLGAATSFRFTGRCTTANRTVPHADITAFRITATSPSGSSISTATTAYDGVASDVYADLPGGATTAIDITWNSFRGASRYSLSLQPIGGSFLECANASHLGPERSFVYTGRCPGKAPPTAPSGVTRLRVCAQDARGTSLACGEAAYDGRAPRVSIAIL